MTNSWRKRTLALAGAVAAFAVVVAGCSDDDGDTSGDGVDLSVLGEADAASGDPVEIMFNTPGNKSSAYTNETEVAEATVKYINENLGGINGRPIKLTMCFDELQAANARECANKAVGSKAVAVLSGTPSNPDTIAAVTSPAGLPYFMVNGGGKESLTAPNSYVVTNTVGGIVGLPAELAKERGYQKAAILVIDAPLATQPITGMGKLVFGNAGVELEVVTVPPGTADMTPQVQAVIDSGAKLVQVLGDIPFCTGAFKAMTTLNADIDKVAISNCVSSESAAQIPGGYEGITIRTTEDTNPDSADRKLFNAVLQKYGADGKEDGATAFRSLVAFQRSLSGMSGDITRESIVKRLNAQPEPVESPLAAGLTFQCGTKPMAVTPNVCSGGIIAGTSDKDGNVSDVKTYDVAPLFKMPAAG